MYNEKLWLNGKGGQEPREAPEQGEKIIKTTSVEKGRTKNGRERSVGDQDV